jgi:hypothetical protein
MKKDRLILIALLLLAPLACQRGQEQQGYQYQTVSLHVCSLLD